MKIGIITFWESQDNYGQLLQGYALQTYLENMGHEAFLIKYKRIPPIKKQSFIDRVKNFGLKRFLKNRMATLKPAVASSNTNTDRHFDSFRDTHIHFSPKTYTNVEELKALPPEADAYICGSDQVWNNLFSVSCEAFLLGFGNKNVKRIAYAASFGMKKLPAETAQLFQKHIHDFEAVSVREKSGLEICKDLGYKSAIWVPDPTMLFNKKQWLQLFPTAESQKKTAEKRLFLYTLGNSSINGRELYIDYANNLTDTEIFHVSANNDYSGDKYPSIPDWLNALSESDFAITNSFHGTLFCILFHKNFVVLPNTGAKAGMNERVISLLEKLDLNDRISYKFDEAHLNTLLFDKIDWQAVDLRINEWTEETRTFFGVLKNE